MEPNNERDERRAMYTELIETTAEPLFGLNEAGAVELVNEAFETLSGYDRAELEGRKLASLVHADDRGQWERHLQILRNDRTTDTEGWEGRLVTNNGTNVDVGWECTVVTGNRVVGRACDIRSGQQQEERLEILNRALRHNIRNQMNVIMTEAERLQERNDAEQRTAGKKIGDIATDIVNLSDKARKAHEHVDIPSDEDCKRELVGPTETVCTQFTITYPSATVETDLPDRAGAIAPPAYGVALTELIENAIVHHPSGNGPVTVRLTTDDERVVVTVEDECEPIPENILTTVYRGIEEPLRHNDGLGLWLVRWIVEPVGGDLSVDRRDDDSGNAVTLAFDGC